ncbi:MAG: thermonuclease family protein [Pseudomonadota bacterium]
MGRWGVWGICLWMCACAPASPLPDMQPGETGRVTKIIDGDGLILDTGQRVRLISITAPVLTPRDGAPDLYAGESARMLEDMALGRRVRLFYPGVTRDRYDRALAHVVTTDAAGAELWLNREMIARGGARVRLYASTAARAQDLTDAENLARQAEFGLWSLPEYDVREASEFAGDERGFVIITTRLGPRYDSSEPERFPPACLRRLEGAEMHLKIDRDAGSACAIANGTSVEVRGWLDEGALELRHPLHLRLRSID